MNKRLVTLTSSFVMLFALGQSHAALVTYTSLTANSSAFDTAAASADIVLTVDGYEDLGPGIVDYGLSLARTDYVVSSNGLSAGRGIRSTSTAADVIEGNRSMVIFNNTDPLTFTFGSAINAFGVTFGDIDMDFGGVFTYSIDGGASQTLLSAGIGNDLDYFFGVIDTVNPFTSISFNRNERDGYYFDIANYGIVNAVPVPAAVWLFGTALVGLFGFGRRRKAA